MSPNTRHIQGKDGKMQGSIGKGKTPPTSGKSKPKVAIQTASPQLSAGMSDDEIVRSLSTITLSHQMVNIAKRKATPVDILVFFTDKNKVGRLAGLQASDQRDVRDSALANPSIPQDILTQIYKRERMGSSPYNLEEKLLANPNLGEEVLRQIVGKSHEILATTSPGVGAESWLSRVSAHPNCPTDLLNLAIHRRLLGPASNPNLTRAQAKALLDDHPRRQLLLALIRNRKIDRDLFHYLIPTDVNGRYPDGTRIHPTVLRTLIKYLPPTPERQRATDILSTYNGKVNTRLVIQKTQDQDALLNVVAHSQSQGDRHAALRNRNVPEEAEVVAALRGENIAAIRARGRRT